MYIPISLILVFSRHGFLSINLIFFIVKLYRYLTYREKLNRALNYKICFPISSAGNPDRHVQTTRIKKRISVIDDMTRVCDDDSDEEIDLSPNGASSITGDENVFAVTEDGRLDTASKSESLLSSPPDGWDISPDGIRSSEVLETSITERNDSPVTLVESPQI